VSFRARLWLLLALALLVGDELVVDHVGEPALERASPPFA
jgi:hypothetical protein